MGHIICVASQKGGTGKTTTAVNLAASLALLEKDTLLVDCDPLGNATTGAVSPREILAESPLDRLQVLPARIGLHHAEKRLAGLPEPEGALRDLVRQVAVDYSYTIIDSPPAFGFLTRSALGASDFLLLPLQQQIFAFEGLSQLLLMVRGIQKTINPGLKIAGVFYTMCRGCTGNDPLLKSGDFDFLKDKLFKTSIPWDDTLSRASDHTRPAALLDALSSGSMGYIELARELLDLLAGSD